MLWHTGQDFAWCASRLESPHEAQAQTIIVKPDSTPSSWRQEDGGGKWHYWHVVILFSRFTSRVRVMTLNCCFNRTKSSVNKADALFSPKALTKWYLWLTLALGLNWPSCSAVWSLKLETLHPRAPCTAFALDLDSPHFRRLPADSRVHTWVGLEAFKTGVMNRATDVGGRNGREDANYENPIRNERWKMKSEEWKKKNEKRKMKNEKWKKKNEKWKMKNENWRTERTKTLRITSSLHRSSTSNSISNRTLMFAIYRLRYFSDTIRWGNECKLPLLKQ